MEFINIVNDFEASKPCTSAFVYLKKNMKKMLESDSENASVYLFLYNISLSHHRFYEDQEMSPDFSKEAKMQMMIYLNQLLKSLSMESKSDTFSVLSDISYDYLTGNHVLGP